MFLGSFLWLRGRNESHFSRGKWLWIPEKPLAGRVRGGGRGVLLSQRGAAGSFEDVCPAHSFTSQQLERPCVGMTGTQGPAQEKGGVGAKLDGCSPSPQTGFSRAKWGSRKPPPTTTTTPGFGGFREIREVCAFGCSYVRVWAFDSP